MARPGLPRLSAAARGRSCASAGAGPAERSSIAIVLAFKPQVILGEAQAILEASKNGTGLVNRPVGMIAARHCVEDRLLPHNLQLSFCDPPLRHSEG